MSEQLDGWYWVEWRGTLEPELFRDGRIQDHDGDWIMPAPTRKIGPRIPEPKELKATELELAKLRNLVDDLEKTLAETREERDRLRAEVERLKPKSNGEWRFFAPAFELPGCWAVRGEKGFAFLAFSKTVGEAEWCVADRQEITAAEAYARLADWPEGQRKFLELTGYVPPTCKESLPVQPEERVRCYRSSGTPSALWVYTHNERVFFYPREDDCLTHGVWDELLPDVPRKPIPLAEALEIVRDRPKQLAKLKEMAGIETPKEEVRCYRNNWGKLWVFTSSPIGLFFKTLDDLTEPSVYAEDEMSGISAKRIPLSEALEIVRDRPKQLAKLREIAGIEDSVRCYRQDATPMAPMVLVYGIEKPICFGSNDGEFWVSFGREGNDRHIPCTISQARALLADKPASLAEFDRITGHENRERLARLMAIPCKEMRV